MKNFQETNELTQSSTFTQKNKNRTKKKATVKIVVIFSMVVACLFIFYGYNFSIGKDKIKNDNEAVSDNKFVKGDYDVKKKSKQKNVVSKYSFPVLTYKPFKKDGVSDLVIPNAHASVILDVDSGTLLHYKNGEKQRQIASLTKLMTAILVVENVNDLDNEAVTVGEEAVYVEGTRIGCPRSGYCISTRLKVGEKISVKSLLMAMLMNSANDSATALAEHIGGSQEKFVKMMNNKAEELGLKNTHFCTPSGLEIDGQEDECYSSAYDVARIAAYSMKYKIIWNIFKMPGKEIYSMDGKITHKIFNTDRLLGEMPNCLGTKTGFTPLAGKSLMLAAIDKTGRHKVIAVVLNDPYRWRDAKDMVNWAFNSYNWE